MESGKSSDNGNANGYFQLFMARLDYQSQRKYGNGMALGKMAYSKTSLPNVRWQMER